MKTTIVIKSIFGKVLFEFEKENNSIKETVEEAVRRHISLNCASLDGASLNDASLNDASLNRASLNRASLDGASLKKLINQTTILPEGELVVWKKLRENLIAKLLIPAKAKRVNAAGYRKCRFEFAKVIAIYDGKKKVKEGISKQQSDFMYKVGAIVTPDSFDPSPLIECSHGINAFITKQEAIDY